MLPFPELVAKPVPPCLSCYKENGFILAHLLELNLSAVSGPAHLSIQTPFTDSLHAQILRSSQCHLTLQAALDCGPCRRRSWPHPPQRQPLAHCLSYPRQPPHPHTYTVSPSSSSPELLSASGPLHLPLLLLETPHSFLYHFL